MLSHARVSAILVAFVTSSLWAADRPAPRPYVVVIGVGKYTDAGITRRPHAERDAVAFYDLFSDKNRLGSGPDRIKLLLGTPDKTRPGVEATRANILEAIAWLGKNATADDSVLFAFFGAGGSIGEKEELGYFASDADGKDAAAVTAHEIAAVFEKLPCRHVTVLLDVHFAVRERDKANLKLSTKPFGEFLSYEKGETDEAKPGRTLFLATNGLEPAVDLPDRGSFAEAVDTGLRGGADKAGGDKDGILTAHELTAWLNVEMPRLRREKAPGAKPALHLVLGTRETHQVVLAHEPKARAAVDEQKAKLMTLKNDGALSDELFREGSELLSLMPTSEPRQRMRKEYQSLALGRVTAEQFREAREKLLEELKLPRKAAERFATSVLDAAENVAERSVYEPKVPVMVGHAVRGMFRRLDEPVPMEIDRRLEKADAMTDEQCRDLLIDSRIHLGNRPDLANHKDVDIALQRMLAGIDPFTTYIDPDSKQRFDADTRGSFFGVGLQIRNDEDTDLIRVITPIRNSPGQNAGIRAGDLIERITRHVDSNGKALDKPEVIEARGLDVNDAVRVILGKVGTKVTLTIRRGMEKPFDVELTRAVVRTESVLGHRRKDDASWDYMIDADKKIGYIRVSSFQEDALRAFAAPVADLKKAGMTGLVLDLRFNPGGYLMAAYGICDLLIEDGVVVTVKPRSGKEAAYKGRKPGSETDFPVVCLVNSYSASGSEIVAACLQDHNRAIICGERTYGKGSVQHTEPFEGGLLKFTMARYYRPSGKNVDKLSTKGGDDEDWGVRPDSQFEVKLSRKENDDIAEAMRDVEIIGGDPKKQKKATDRQLEKALEYLRAKK